MNRNFALSNIECAELLEQTFSRRRDFSVQKYAERSFGVFQEKPVGVLWKFSAKAAPDAREFLFHPSQIMKRPRPREMSWHLFSRRSTDR